ncbi:hypothetical protein LR004_02435 [Candidatus Gracilibacteria bacterium]|nr:hypothetical protein [Candidatus Gracilibacteria bacterium]
MQHLNKNASILIWAVMLSLIVTISFISISTKINKNIKSSGKIYEDHSQNNNIKSALFNKNNTQISDKKVIVFEDSNTRIISLKHGEKRALSFSGIENFNIDLGIIEGGGVLYKYTGTNTYSGVLDYSHSFSGTLDGTNNTGSLVLENIGGYSEILIKSENSFVTPEKRYKIVQTIGNNNFIKSRGTTSQ